MKSKTSVAAALVIAGALLAASCSREHGPKAKTAIASVDRDIREHLPTGSSRSDVETFLDQRHIEHSYVGELKEIPENGHTEQAIIRDVSANGILKSDIQILFKFDSTDSKLVNYTVREIFTGP